MPDVQQPHSATAAVVWARRTKAAVVIGLAVMTGVAFRTDFVAFGLLGAGVNFRGASLSFPVTVGTPSGGSTWSAPPLDRVSEAATDPGNVAPVPAESTTELDNAAVQPGDDLLDSADSAKQSALAPVELPSAGVAFLGASVVYNKGRECQFQAHDFGHVDTADACGRMAASVAECGAHFMFSVAHPDWKCRCCTTSGADGGPFHPDWDVYAIADLRNRSVATPALASPSLPIPPTHHSQPPALVPMAQSPLLPDDSNVDAVIQQGHTQAFAKGYELFIEGQECSEQGENFGHIKTRQECDKLTAEMPLCGQYYMFSKVHPDWHCRCCAPGGELDGPPSAAWAVYKVLTPRPKTFLPLPTAPAVSDPFAGLTPLVADGPRPSWLLKQDALIADTRPGIGGGILILQPVLMDVHSDWGKRSGSRPRWLRAVLSTNRNHAIRQGHAMVLRAQPTQPQLTPWEVRRCGAKSTHACVVENERENYNWEKHLMMAEYLMSPENFSHVLMLDADAAIVHPDHPTLESIAAILEKEEKELFLTDEDWLENGKGRINGGLMFARNTPFTRALFQDTFDAHVAGPSRLKKWRIGVRDMECSSNEQICLNDLWRGSGQRQFAPKAILASGLVYNRGAERGGNLHIDDQSVEIMHWMGGSKHTAGVDLCNGKFDLTGGGPSSYGCRDE